MSNTNRNFKSTVTERILASSMPASSTDTTTTMTLDSIANFPDYPFTLVIAPDTSTEEIVTVTGASGSSNQLNVKRGQDGTTAAAHGTTTDGSTTKVRHMITARDLQEPQDHIQSSNTVHGISSTEGSVVGTLKTQTLTNKTLTGPVINSPTISGGTISSSTISGSVISSPTLSGTTLATSGTIAFGTNGTAITANGVTINATEIAYLDGLTSNIQNQINSLNPSGGTFSNLTLSGTTTNSGTIALGTNANAITANGTTISATEIGYLDSVTSNIQTQINNIGTWQSMDSASAFLVGNGITSLGTGGSLTGRYTQIGKTIHFEVKLTLGTSPGLVNGQSIIISLPYVSENTAESPNWMAGNLTVSGNYYALNCRLIGSSLIPFCFIPSTSIGQWVALTPNNLITIGSGTVININGTFEAV